MLVELAGASGAQDVANMELEQSHQIFKNYLILGLLFKRPTASRLFVTLPGRPC